MGDELPILKGILNGVVNYHNARRCPFDNDNDSDVRAVSIVIECLAYFLIEDSQRAEQQRLCARERARGTFISPARKSCAFPYDFFSPLARNHIWCDGTHALNSRRFYRSRELHFFRLFHTPDANITRVPILREGHLAIAVRCMIHPLIALTIYRRPSFCVRRTSFATYV